MVELPRLALDIAVPPNALARRGGVTISEDIILTFLQVRNIFFSIVYYLFEFLITMNIYLIQFFIHLLNHRDTNCIVDNYFNASEI